MLIISAKFRNRLMIGLASAIAILIALFLQLPDGRFHVIFLNIGQGDSIFIQTPSNHQILIDGGPENKVMEELAEVMPYADKSIDMVVLTHPHADHIEGLLEVLKRYEVGAVLYTGVLYDDANYEEFLRMLREGVISGDFDVFLAESDVDFVFGNVEMDVIYPFEVIAGQKFENVNNSSIAVRLLYRDKVILLTGDLEIEAESELVNSGIDLAADVLKAGHHGSRTASNDFFLKKVHPHEVVIQVGEENEFGHPHSETLRRFYRAGVEKIWRNDEDGRVEFVF